MNDCRLALDNLNDYVALRGPLLTGSDVIDLASAQMTPEATGWKIAVKTVGPAQQHPRLENSIMVFLDADGRTDTNMATGSFAGADTAYGLVYDGASWQLVREIMNQAKGDMMTTRTNAAYSIDKDGYTLNIPYTELPKGAPAYWRIGAVAKDSERATVDYIPDAGFLCVPSLAPANRWLEFAARAKGLWYAGANDIVVSAAVVMAAVAVVFWRWRNKKKKLHDL